MIINFEASIDGSIYLSLSDFALMQNVALQLLVAHNHDGINSRKIYDNEVEVGKQGDPAPVGFSAPTDPNTFVLFSDHVANTAIHSPTSGGTPGRLVAHGWTEPVYVRFVVATPIFEKGNPFPFPTYNMSPLLLSDDFDGKVLNYLDSDFTEKVLYTGFSRHDFPEGYSPYRHYLYMIPPYGKFDVNSEHTAYLDGKSVVFAHTPVFIDAKDTEFLSSIKENSLQYRDIATTYKYDYEEEKVWSKYEPSTCFLGGYKTVVGGDQKSIAVYFSDHYNEFNQLLSQVNYQVRELNKVFSPVIYNSQFDAEYVQTSSVFDPDYDYNGLVKSSIKGTPAIRPYKVAQREIVVKKTGRYTGAHTLDQSLSLQWGETCVIYKQGIQAYLATKGVSNSFINNYELNIPTYVENEGGEYQVFILKDVINDTNVESGLMLNTYNTRELSYMIREGYISVPYEIWSHSSTLSVGTATKEFVGTSDTLSVEVQEIVMRQVSASSISSVTQQGAIDGLPPDQQPPPDGGGSGGSGGTDDGGSSGGDTGGGDGDGDDPIVVIVIPPGGGDDGGDDTGGTTTGGTTTGGTTGAGATAGAGLAIVGPVAQQKKTEEDQADKPPTDGAAPPVAAGALTNALYLSPGNPIMPIPKVWQVKI